jgi:hypothetical protein
MIPILLIDKTVSLARPAARFARASRNLRTALQFGLRKPRGKKLCGDESKAQHGGGDSRALDHDSMPAATTAPTVPLGEGGARIACGVVKQILISRLLAVVSDTRIDPLVPAALAGEGPAVPLFSEAVERVDCAALFKFAIMLGRLSWY